jgi:hypothetical protein
MASLYLRSRTHQAFDIRDGRKAEDPVRQVGRRPVKFDNLTDSSGTPLDAAFFERDPQIEAIASEAQAKEIIAQLDKVEASAKAEAKKAADAAAAEEARILKEREEESARASALLKAQADEGVAKEEGQGKKKNKD